jgi:hypothetical protein
MKVKHLHKIIVNLEQWMKKNPEAIVEFDISQKGQFGYLTSEIEGRLEHIVIWIPQKNMAYHGE